MTQLNSPPQQDLPGSDSDHQSAILARLKALKTDTPDEATETPQWRIWWIVGAIAAALLTIFFVAVGWRLYVPSDRTLEGGWIRVVDRQWGVQVDFPNWYQKRYDDTQSVQYMSRFANSYEARVQIYNWKRKNFATKTAQEHLASIVANERQSRPVKVIIDRSRDLASPMIDFVSTCGQAGGYQWTVRERVMIQRDAIIRIHITRPEDVPPGEVERFMESVQWLKK